MFHSETYNLTITIDQQGSIPSIKHVIKSVSQQGQNPMQGRDLLAS